MSKKVSKPGGLPGGRPGRQPRGNAGNRPYGRKPNVGGYGRGDQKRPPKNPGER